ncbi:TolC family protein [Herbaspirillum chlorophenolicum]|uniref:TolC family protein n=1 Tax=Herbaspirillum chlorophenolicum TaxID=211589 RepID=A0ABW8F0C0_9BURK
MKKLPLTLALTLALAGCASYRPLPLHDQPTWLTEIPHLAVATDRLGFPSLPPHPFAPGADGLDMTDVAILAVINNPDLRLARDDAGIAHAQAFSASLLPDPQLSMSADFKRHPDPGASRGYTIGPSYDFGSLLTHSALASAGRHDADKADLNLLWQEWQVIAQARLLYIRIVEGQRLLDVLAQQRDFLAQRVDQVQQALAKQLITLDVSNSALTALLDVNRQTADAEKSQNQLRHDLNTLLGLAPSVPVPLKKDVSLPEIDTAAMQAIMQRLPARRPDLLALKSGYQAQDSRYRAAIIAQFPALSIGLTRARDTSNVASQGFNISLSLPIFNRNRGNIAIEKATRQRLHDEYQQRVNAAYTDVDRLLKEQDINAGQLHRAQDGLRQMERQRAATMQAFGAGNLDTLVLINTEASLLAKQIEAITLEQSMLEQRVALLSVIGGELPLQFKESEHHE